MSGPDEKTIAINARTDLARHVLDAYRFEYRDYSDWWRDIDSKAQGTAAFAGVLLTVVAGYVSTSTVEFSLFEAITLSLTVVLLFASILFGAKSLLARDTDIVPEGHVIDELAREILAKPENELAERVTGLVFDQAPHWKTLNSEMHTACWAKSSDLNFSQYAVIFAALCLLVLALNQVFVSTNRHHTGGNHEVQLQGMQQRSGPTEQSVCKPSIGYSGEEKKEGEEEIGEGNEKNTKAKTVEAPPNQSNKAQPTAAGTH